MTLVKINEQGRRVGESHPRAALLDHEVDLLMELLDEREKLIGEMLFAGAAQVEVDAALTAKGLSYRCLAIKFEVHKQTVAKIAKGYRRCQTVAVVKPYP